MDIPIPNSKADLFKILILKDYYSKDDREKNKLAAID